MNGNNKSESKRPKVIYIIDIILLSILIIAVIYAQVRGAYVDTEIIPYEVCNGEITQEGMKTLKNLNIKLPENVKEGETEWMKIPK